MHDTIWVLFDTTSGDTILCGTAFNYADAQKWSASRNKRGAIQLPVDDLADGEEW